MILFFNPTFKETIWGGTKLKDQFGYSLNDNPYGECWGISAHPNGESTVKDGEFQGKPISWLWNNKRALFGDKEGEEFPILVKIIDATDNLSIQVHPDDAYAKQFNSFGKTECWYILDCDKDSEIIIGNTAKNKQEIIDAVENNRVQDMVQRLPIKPGDSFNIQAGTLHAICKNTLLLEVQQSSDLTYRFDDYNRLYNGQKRPLHIKEAIDVVKVPNKTIDHSKTTDIFTFDVYTIKNENKYKAHKYGDFMVILNGEGTIDDRPIKKGDFLFISSNSNYQLTGDLKISKINLK